MSKYKIEKHIKDDIYSIEEIPSNIVEQIRADTIEPIKQIINESEKMMWHSSKTLEKIKEQLKEQKE